MANRSVVSVASIVRPTSALAVTAYWIQQRSQINAVSTMGPSNTQETQTSK